MLYRFQIDFLSLSFTRRKHGIYHSTLLNKYDKFLYLN